MLLKVFKRIFAERTYFFCNNSLNLKKNIPTFFEVIKKPRTFAPLIYKMLFRTTVLKRFEKSNFEIFSGRFQSGQMGRTVNPLL